jgi:hypothetical protein
MVAGSFMSLFDVSAQVKTMGRWYYRPARRDGSGFAIAQDRQRNDDPGGGAQYISDTVRATRG